MTDMTVSRPVTWLDIARINATRWAAIGAGFGVAATAACWVRERWSR